MNYFEASCECVFEKKNEDTIRAIRGDFGLYAEFLYKRYKISDPQLSVLNDEYVEAYKQCLIDENFRRSTIGRRVGHIKQLAKWCKDRGHIEKVLTVKTPKELQQCPKSLTEEEEERFRSTALKLVMGGEKGLTTAEEKKNKAMGSLAIFLLETGVRLSEGANLKRKQLQDDEARNVRGKADGLRDLLLSDECRKALNRYLETRRDSDEHVWPYCGHTLRRWIYKIGDMCGVKIHPHMLRHTLAIRFLDKTKNLAMTAQALGHGDIRHTLRYTYYSKEKMLEVYNNRRQA